MFVLCKVKMVKNIIVEQVIVGGCYWLIKKQTNKIKINVKIEEMIRDSLFPSLKQNKWRFWDLRSFHRPHLTYDYSQNLYSYFLCSCLYLSFGLFNDGLLFLNYFTMVKTYNSYISFLETPLCRFPP